MAAADEGAAVGGDAARAEVAACIAQSLALHRAGRFGEALAFAERGLAIDPDNAQLLNHVGVFAARLGDPARAERAYRHAIACHPDAAEVRFNLGNLMRGQGRADEAEAAYRQAIELRAGYAEAWCNLGNLFRDRGRAADAEAAYREASTRNPSFADPLCNLGNLLLDQRRLDAAEAAYRAAIERRPDYAEAWSNLGVLLKAGGRMAEAEAAQRQAIARRPDYAPAWSNLGVLLMDLKRVDAAVAACRQATALQPAYGDAWVNLGNALQYDGSLAAAEEAYRMAMPAMADPAEARWNLSLLLLRQGRYAEGWPEHEARYSPARRRRKTLPPAFVPGTAAPPQWRGEALAGKSLLVWPEQGLGDEIQFLRYLPLLRSMGAARLTLACKPPLLPLLRAQQPALADDVIAVSGWQPGMAAGIDCWCYLLSLPLHFGTTLETIPAAIPYLRADPLRARAWRERLPAAGLRVGLVWKGNPGHANDANRSLPSLQLLQPLLAIAGICFVSLQKGAGEEEARAAHAAGRLFHAGDAVADFADSAAVLDGLDLVVTVDTAIAHLAGAMGRPCRVLLPAFGTDWRWMDGRRDSPWYPGVMQLRRQGEKQGWEPAIAELAAELAGLAVARSAAR